MVSPLKYQYEGELYTDPSSENMGMNVLTVCVFFFRHAGICMEGDEDRKFSMTVKEVAVVNFSEIKRSKEITGAREAIQVIFISTFVQISMAFRFSHFILCFFFLWLY